MPTCTPAAWPLVLLLWQWRYFLPSHGASTVDLLAAGVSRRDELGVSWGQESQGARERAGPLLSSLSLPLFEQASGGKGPSSSLVSLRWSAGDDLWALAEEMSPQLSVPGPCAEKEGEEARATCTAHILVWQMLQHMVVR